MLKVSQAAERDALILFGKTLLVEGVHNVILRYAIQISTKTIRKVENLLTKYGIDDIVNHTDQWNVKT